MLERRGWISEILEGSSEGFSDRLAERGKEKRGLQMMAWFLLCLGAGRDNSG